MQEYFDFHDRTALVTGGSRGVGREVVRMLARAGARVLFTWRNRESEAGALVDELRAAGTQVLMQQHEQADEESTNRLFQRVQQEFGGKLDFCIANAGIWPVQEIALEKMTTEHWRRTMSVNLDGVFYLLRQALPMLRDQGRIVLLSSTAGQDGEAWHADYAATKGALISLAKSLAAELGPRGITVNCVAPGWIDTEMVAPVINSQARESILNEIPLRRIATAEDVAGPIVFLCSPLARHITGEVLNINGGSVLCG